MTKTYNYRDIVWIDLESPDENEIAGLVRRYGLHPLVGEELRSASSSSKASSYGDHAVVSLKVPLREKDGKSYTVGDRDIDFIIGRNFLITSREEALDQLEYFAKVFETNAILGKDENIKHAGHLFYLMMKRIYAGMLEDLENLKDALVAAEVRIFRGDEEEMVRTLSNVSRELIDFKQASRAHRDVWETFPSGDGIFGEDFAPYMADIRDEFNKVNELVANCRELLSDLRETNDSLLNTKQNRIIKMLTLTAFIFYPLTFIAALFTIPAAQVPFIRDPWGWSGIAAFMVAITLVIWFTFKKKRWI